MEQRPTLSMGFIPSFAQGYATEAAAAVFNYGLHTLNLSNVNADVDEPNTASVRVLQKLGMQQVRSATVNDRRLLYFSFL
jgi:ribosomal-protein-alanine N-acetyltransferase